MATTFVPSPASQGPLSTSPAPVGHVFLDVRRRRLHCLNQTARQMHGEGIPFVPADLDRHHLYNSLGNPIAAKDLPLIVAWREQTPVEAQFVLPRPPEPAWEIAWTATPFWSGSKLAGILGTVCRPSPEIDWQVMAELAHDLRTPLQSMRLASAILEKMPPTHADFAKQLESLRSTADRAVHLALELLEWARGPVRSKRARGGQWFALEPYLTAIAEEQVMAAQHKGLDLITDWSPIAGWEIFTDRQRLGRILANLLVNSVRYTSCGQVKLATSWRSGAGERRLAVSVVDSGPGISPEEQESIFHPFERGQIGREADSSGSGLGLAVVDRLAEELGLTIELSSQSGAGSAFHLLIPISILRKK